MGYAAIILASHAEFTDMSLRGMTGSISLGGNVAAALPLRNQTAMQTRVDQAGRFFREEGDRHMSKALDKYHSL